MSVCAAVVDEGGNAVATMRMDGAQLGAYQLALDKAWTAIKVRDPGAKVVLAGITQRAWEEIEELYRVGRIKGSFDVAALQRDLRDAGQVLAL